MKRSAFPVLFYAIVHGLGYFYPARLWGADQLHYYPLWVGIGCGVVGLVAIWLMLQPAQMTYLDAVLLRLQRFPVSAAIWQGGFALVFSGLAYFFRDRSHLLGDSDKWFSILQHALIGDVAVAEIPGHHSHLNIPGYEYINIQQALDLYTHFQVYRLGHALWGWQPSNAYEILSCLAGGFYAFVLWKIAALLAPEFLSRLSLWGLLLAMGSVQYFFGYGESYTLATLAAALYIWCSLCYLQGGTSLLYPTLALLLAGAFHLLSFSFALSWLYLLWRAPGRLGALVRQPRLYGPLLAVGTGCAAYVYFKVYRFMHMPLWDAGEEGYYAILSIPHLANWANELLLLGPFAVVWGLVFVFSRRVATEPVSFLGWAALGSSTLLFVHYISMGGRDWDLMGFSGLACALWGCACLEAMGDNKRAWQQVRWGILPILIMHSALWIGTNHHVERANARLGNLLKYYPNQPLHYQQYTLGHYYLNIAKKDFSQAASHFRQAIQHTSASDIERLNRYEKNLGAALYHAGQYEESIATFASVFTRQGALLAYQTDMAFHRVWLAAILAEANAAQRDSARRAVLVRQAFAHDHRLQSIQVQRAQLLQRAGDYAEAEKILTEMAKQRPDDAEVFYNLGVLKAIEKDFAAAVAAYRKAIELDPQNASFYTRLAAVYSAEGDRAQTIETYRQAVQLGAVDVEMYFALGLLYEQEGRREDAALLYGQLLDENRIDMEAEDYVQLGIALFGIGAIERAQQAYGRALQLDGQHVAARVNWGWCLYLQSNFDGAIEAYRSALARAPNIQAHFNMGLAYLAKGDLSQARAIYAEGIAQYGVEPALAIGAADDLRALVGRGVQTATAEEILRRYWKN